TAARGSTAPRSASTPGRRPRRPATTGLVPCVPWGHSTPQFLDGPLRSRTVSGYRDVTPAAIWFPATAPGHTPPARPRAGARTTLPPSEPETTPRQAVVRGGPPVPNRNESHGEAYRASCPDPPT